MPVVQAVWWAPPSFPSHMQACPALTAEALKSMQRACGLPSLVAFSLSNACNCTGACPICPYTF